MLTHSLTAGRALVVVVVARVGALKISGKLFGWMSLQIKKRKKRFTKRRRLER
jgi:hypothetical protein